MYDLLFDAQQKFGAGAAKPDRLDALAQQIGLDSAQFDTCLAGSAARDFIKVSDAYANQRGLISTPTILVYVRGQRVASPANASNHQTPGDQSALSAVQMKALIAGALSTTPRASPTNTPDAFDFSSATLYKSDGAF